MSSKKKLKHRIEFWMTCWDIEYHKHHATKAELKLENMRHEEELKSCYRDFGKQDDEIERLQEEIKKSKVKIKDLEKSVNYWRNHVFDEQIKENNKGEKNAKS